MLMQKVMLPSGIEVVYNDDRTVSLEREGLRLRSLVITLAHLLALIGAHLEVVARRKNRTVKHISLTVTNHPVGQFIELIVRTWQLKFGERILVPRPISFRPGMDMTFGSRIRVTATGAPTVELTLDERLAIEQMDGNEFRVPETDWHQMMMSAALELLGPMWQQIGSPREVSASVLRNPGWEMMAQALVHNRWVMWLAWILLAPFLWMRGVWQRFRLAEDTTFYAAQLLSGLAGVEARVSSLQELAAAAQRAQAKAEAETLAASSKLARDEQAIQTQRRILDTEASAVKEEVARLTAAHEQVVAELRGQLTTSNDTKAGLELTVETQAATIVALQQLVDNYQAALRELPPES